MAIPRNLANFAAGIDASNNIKAASGIFGTTPATTGVVRIPNNSPIFARNPGNDGDRHVIAFNSSGEVAIAGDGNNTVIGTSVGTVKTPTTISVGGATPAASGAGITFPNTWPTHASSDANTLDDYEEGTWTPAIIGSTTAGTGTYAGRSGTYTKIGRMVYVRADIEWTAHTGTGNMYINGLPFTSSVEAGVSIGQMANIALSANHFLFAGVYTDSTIRFWEYPLGGGAGNFLAMDSAGFISVGFSYLTTT